MVLSWNLRGGTDKNNENLSKNSQSLGRNLNNRPPDYEAVLITGQRSWVPHYSYTYCITLFTFLTWRKNFRFPSIIVYFPLTLLANLTPVAKEQCELHYIFCSVVLKGSGMTELTDCFCKAYRWTSASIRATAPLQYVAITYSS